MIDKEFSFKVLANTEGGPRDATIIFKNADASEHIVIKQAGKELTYPAVIPDKVLKTYIMTNFDTNKDGEISKEEAEAVKAIELTGRRSHRSTVWNISRIWKRSISLRTVC